MYVCMCMYIYIYIYIYIYVTSYSNQLSNLMYVYLVPLDHSKRKRIFSSAKNNLANTFNTFWMRCTHGPMSYLYFSPGQADPHNLCERVVRAFHSSLSWARWMKFTSSRPSSWGNILILWYRTQTNFSTDAEAEFDAKDENKVQPTPNKKPSGFSATEPLDLESMWTEIPYYTICLFSQSPYTSTLNILPQISVNNQWR